MNKYQIKWMVIPAVTFKEELENTVTMGGLRAKVIAHCLTPSFPIIEIPEGAIGLSTEGIKNGGVVMCRIIYLLPLQDGMIAERVDPLVEINP